MAPESRAGEELLKRAPSRTESLAARLRRFARKPMRSKIASLGERWVRHIPLIPFPVRLPWGDWWLVENDACGMAILQDCFEVPEREMVERIVEPAMTVLDVGAHHGYYTLLVSHKAGEKGRVLAFEPSPRERAKLLRHLRLNRRTNVILEPLALGAQEGEAELFVVEGVETGCNSLRQPDVSQPTRKLRVPVATLDSVLERRCITRVDFVKMDVEGAELSVLKGASRLLATRPRPVILCEVEEIRTGPWGYDAREILQRLEEANFQWFRPAVEGPWAACSSDATTDGNFLGVPAEKVESLITFGLLQRRRAA